MSGKLNEKEIPEKSGSIENRAIRDALLKQVVGGGSVGGRGKKNVPTKHNFEHGRCTICRLSQGVYIASGKKIPCK